MTTKDSYEIIQHNRKVSTLAEAFARDQGFSEEIAQIVSVAGVFIDLGKIAMDYRVFAKKEALTDEEYEYIKQHASKSTQMLIQSHLISREILTCIIHHHEDYDGNGYPSHVKGEAIPLGARILKLCDVYYALKESRPYREKFSHEEAIKIMKKEHSKFDPKLLNKFIEYVEKRNNN